MTATSFILNLSKRTPLFSAEVWNLFVFFILFYPKKISAECHAKVVKVCLGVN